MFPKSTLPNCKVCVANLIFGYFVKFTLSSLPSPLRQIAKSISFHCHVHVPKSPTPHCHGDIAKLPSPLDPMDCLNELQAANKLKSFWYVQCLNIFWFTKTSGLEENIALDLFFH